MGAAPCAGSGSGDNGCLDLATTRPREGVAHVRHAGGQQHLVNDLAADASDFKAARIVLLDRELKPPKGLGAGAGDAFE
eukprot:7935565-Alexandrium_andersonii.AAC.1